MWKSQSDFISTPTNPAPDMRQPRPRGARPLYFMTKPSPDLAAAIHNLRRVDCRRSADLLHVTLLPLVDLADMPPEFVRSPLEIMRDFEAEAFNVVFDRIHERRCVTLRGSEPMLGAKACQVALMQFLRKHDFRYFGDAPEPHVTIKYRRDGLGDETIDPISWRVEELLLVESLVGQAEHRVHGRWSLRV